MTDIYIQKVVPNSTDTGFTVKKEYKLPNVNSFSIDLNSPVSPMPLPEEGADSNILVKIEGNSATMSLNWIIKNETATPVTVTESGGASNILTALQQVGYFTNEPGEGSFQPHSVADNYRIQLKNGSTVLWEKLGFFTKFTLSMQGSAPVTWSAQASFIVGNVITSYEAKIPEPPTGVGVTSGATYNGSDVNTASIKVIWDPATISNGTLSGSVVSYQKEGSAIWTNLGVTPTDPNTGTEYILTNLEYQKYYSVKVASRTTHVGGVSNTVTGQAT